MKKNHIIGNIETKAGIVSLVSTSLNKYDYFGAIKVRWSIGRNNYRVKPGIYGVGQPTDTSDVFVTANYKLSFDHLRKNLDGLNAWILVLDTKGVNVWCAAGKGAFGTEELVNQIEVTRLDEIVSHRKIIVPQLGATGISAHQVKEMTSGESSKGNLTSSPVQFNFVDLTTAPKITRGFSVVFGPVRAADIKLFIENGYKSTSAMRKVNFTFADRMKLIPVDLVYPKYQLLIAFLVILILSGLNSKGIDFQQIFDRGIPGILRVLMAYITGIVITPLLLPYMPVRMFAFKGLIYGIVLSIILLSFNFMGTNKLEIASWFLLISSISSFMAMNFTGSSTYTSLSGVKKEMKTFVPVQISCAGTGIILLVLNNLIVLR